MNEDVTKYLAIDYGEVRTGIAITDEDKRFSFSRGFILNSSGIFEKLLHLVKEEKISKIVIGLPLNLKSGKSVQALKVEEFRERLEAFLNSNSLFPELIFFDERFTSSLAKTNILQSGLKKSKRREKGLVDSISAQILLQDFIDKEKNTENRK